MASGSVGRSGRLKGVLMRQGYDLKNGGVVETSCEEAPVIVFSAPNPEERKYLVDTLKIDPHTLSSALDPDELSRLEFEPDHVAMIIKRPKNYSGAEQFLFRVTSMGLFLFEEQLIIVVASAEPLFEGKPNARVATLFDVVLKVINHSIAHFLGHLRVINMVCDELELKINASMENRFLINLFTLEKSMVYYLNGIHANGVLIAKIKNNISRLGLTPEQGAFLDDISVDNDQCYRQAEIHSNVLSGLMDARVSIVSNNLNVLMKTLTVVTIGIMVPNLVVSIFSMNVNMPFPNDHPMAFWGILILTIASAVGVMGYLRIKKFW